MLMQELWKTFEMEELGTPLGAQFKQSAPARSVNAQARRLGVVCGWDARNERGGGVCVRDRYPAVSCSVVLRGFRGPLLFDFCSRVWSQGVRCGRPTTRLEGAGRIGGEPRSQPHKRVTSMRVDRRKADVTPKRAFSGRSEAKVKGCGVQLPSRAASDAQSTSDISALFESRRGSDSEHKGLETRTRQTGR